MGLVRKEQNFIIEEKIGTFGQKYFFFSSVEKYKPTLQLTKCMYTQYTILHCSTLSCKLQVNILRICLAICKMTCVLVFVLQDSCRMFYVQVSIFNN